MKFHKRQSSRRLLGGLSAEVQSLESRCLPAGTVTADISGGNITLNGDKFNNLIEVELTSTGVFVRGVEGTNLKFGARTIADGSSLKLASGPRVTTDLIINLIGRWRLAGGIGAPRRLRALARVLRRQRKAPACDHADSSIPSGECSCSSS